MTLRAISVSRVQIHAGLLWTLAAASCCLASYPAFALLAGLFFALALGNPQPTLTAKVQKYLLQASVVGLGFGIRLDVLFSAGATGLWATALSLLFTLTFGWMLARWFELDQVTGQLITMGTAICGGSAIAVMGPVLGAGQRQMSVALVTVFLLNAVALFLFPLIGEWAGMDGNAFGLWAAMAIHDTSSVAGAAAHFGQAALAVAVAVKLARALWILPMAAGTALLMHRSGKGCTPWFVLGFVAASAVTTYLPGSEEMGRLMVVTARAGLAVSLFLIGTALTREALHHVGWRPLAHATALWLMVSLLSFGAVRAMAAHGQHPAAVISTINPEPVRPMTVPQTGGCP